MWVSVRLWILHRLRQRPQSCLVFPNSNIQFVHLSISYSPTVLPGMKKPEGKKYTCTLLPREKLLCSSKAVSLIAIYTFLPFRHVIIVVISKVSKGILHTVPPALTDPATRSRSPRKPCLEDVQCQTSSAAHRSHALRPSHSLLRSQQLSARSQEVSNSQPHPTHASSHPRPAA